MRKKMKTIRNWGIIILIIIVIYFIFIFAIESMIPSYENYIRTFDYSNLPENSQIGNKKIEEYLSKIINQKKGKKLSKQEVDNIMENEILLEIRNYIRKIGEQEKSPKTTTSESIYIVEQTNYGDLYIFYPDYIGTSNRIIFTKDMNNIYFTNVNDVEANSQANGKVSLQKETILEKAQQQIEKLKINLKTEFSANVIYAREYDMFDTYYIDDENNSLAITYDNTQEEILSLKLGFE